MKTGFLIINYNDSETTIKLLKNIKNYKSLDKIVIVDNHSNDESLSKLKKYENQQIKVLQNSENKGYSAGINLGSRYLIELFGECYIIVSNPDIEIANENVIKKLIASFDERTAVVAPVVKEHTGLNRGWRIPTPLQDAVLNLPIVHQFLRPLMLFYKDKYFKGIVPVEAVSGSFFIINSNDLKEMGFLDENVFLYYEENILGKKLYRKTVINSDVQVFHNHSVTIDKNINYIKKYKILKKSQIYFHRKYNKANKIELGLLHLTNFITLLGLEMKRILKTMRRGKRDE